MENDYPDEKLEVIVIYETYRKVKLPPNLMGPPARKNNN